MNISCEQTPFEFLCEDSWECGDLAKQILDADKVVEFNNLVEEYFNEYCHVSKTRLNDFMRFSQDEILESLGIDAAA